VASLHPELLYFLDRGGYGPGARILICVVGSPRWCLLLLGCEIVDAGAAAPEGRLCVSDEQPCSCGDYFSSTMCMVKSGRRGILMLVVLRQWRNHERIMEVKFDGDERSMDSLYGANVFLERKPSASAPAAVMPAGIVTFLRASLCYFPIP
jgi:hypothetical protein